MVSTQNNNQNQIAISYNLWNEKWISVLFLDGKKEELSLYDTLINADKIARVEDVNPVFEIGIHRLLIAVIMDAFKIKDVADIDAILSANSFDSQKVEQYKKRYFENFDLFGKNMRFYQATTPDEKMKRSSIVRILYDFPNDTAPIMFHRKYDDDVVISPKICAKALCGVSACAFSGGVGYKVTIAGNSPVYSLIQGSNLFETILFNCCPDSILKNTGTQGPAWTLQEHIGKIKYTFDTASVVLGLTWQPRAIHLIAQQTDQNHPFTCDYSGEKTTIGIRELYFANGWVFNDKSYYLDPHVAYMKKKAIQIKDQNKFWRSVGPLYLANSENEIRPKIIDQYISHLMNNSITEIRFQSYALITNNAQLLSWIKEFFILPREILQEQYKADFILDRLVETDKIALSLEMNVITAFTDTKEKKKLDKKKKELLKKKSKRILDQFWNDMQFVFKNSLLQKVSSNHDANAWNEIKEFWATKLRSVAIKSFKLLESMISKGEQYERYHTAFKYLMGSINNELPILKLGDQTATGIPTTPTIQKKSSKKSKKSKENTQEASADNSTAKKPKKSENKAQEKATQEPKKTPGGIEETAAKEKTAKESKKPSEDKKERGSGKQINLDNIINPKKSAQQKQTLNEGNSNRNQSNNNNNNKEVSK